MLVMETRELLTSPVFLTTLMGLIFMRTNFGELKILHFARIYFRELAMLRIFVNTNLPNQPYWDISPVLIFENRLFSVFCGYLFSRIGLPQTFREDLISRI